jgi:hypothetical protein
VNHQLHLDVANVAATWAHQQDGHLTSGKHALSDTAQHRPLQPNPAVGAHDDQIGGLRTTLVEDLLNDVAHPHHAVDLDTAFGQLGCNTLMGGVDGRAGGAVRSQYRFWQHAQQRDAAPVVRAIVRASGNAALDWGVPSSGTRIRLNIGRPPDDPSVSLEGCMAGSRP